MTTTDVRYWSTEALLRARQGCTELTCIYHGEINRELADRGAR